MANRAGKRERQARSRHKRCVISQMIQTPTGTVWLTLKAGNKKDLSFLRDKLSTKCDTQQTIAAVPVDDRGKAT